METGSVLVKTDSRFRAVIKEDFVTIGEGGYLAQLSADGHKFLSSQLAARDRPVIPIDAKIKVESKCFTDIPTATPAEGKEA